MEDNRRAGATELPSPETGIYGGAYEFRVIAYFLLLMVLGAIPPVVCPDTRIRKLVPQNKKKLDDEQDLENPFETDDLIVYCSSNQNNCKILLSMKSNLSFTVSDNETKKVLKAAYRDTQKRAFDKEYDRVVLVTEVLDGNKNGVLGIVNRAKTENSYSRAFPEYSLTNKERDALNTIKKALEEEKNDITDEEIYTFVRSFDAMIMDIRNPLDQDGYSVSLSTILSLVEKYKKPNTEPIDIWNNTFVFASTLDNISGIIEKDNLPSKLLNYYRRTLTVFDKQCGTEVNSNLSNSANVDISMALLGRIRVENEGDLETFSSLRRMTDE